MIEKKILSGFIRKKVLVTGGTGLIGRQIVDILVDAGAKVSIVSLDKSKPNNKAKYIYGDLTNFNFCKKVSRNVDFVFHLAGIKGSIDVTKKKPASFFVPLMMMNTNILEASRINKVKKVVYTSSIGAYSPASVFKESSEDKLEFKESPMDMFPGWAKRMAELQIRAYQIQYGLENFAIVRPCNVYGPGDNFDPENAMVIPSIMAKIARGDDPVIIWGDGSAVRDFLYSKDAAEGIISALFFGTGGRFVNLGSGKGYSIKQLVEILASFIEFNYKFDKTKPSGFPKRVMDISLAKKMIHWQPRTSLFNGLKETWEWFVENQVEYKKKQNYFKN